MKSTKNTSDPINKSIANGRPKLLWWPYITLVVCATLGAWLYINLSSKAYRATAEISVPSRTTTIKDSAQHLNSPTNSLKSIATVRRVVQELGLYAPVYSKSTFSKKLQYKDAPIRITAKHADKLKPTEDIPFNFNQNFVQINGKGYPFNSWIETPYGELMFSINPSVRSLNKGNYYFSIQSIKKLTAALSKKIEINADQKDSRHFYISITDENRDRATAILNHILEAYSENSIAVNNSLTINTAKFINNQLVLVEADLLNIEQKLRVFEIKHKNVSVQEIGKNYLQSVHSKDEQIGGLSIKILVLNQLDSFAKSKMNEGAMAPANIGIADLVLNQLIIELYKKRMNLSRPSLSPENQPKDEQNAFQIKGLESQLRAELQKARDSVDKVVDELSKKTNNDAEALTALNEDEVNLVYLKRQRDIKTNIYTFLLDKKEKTALYYITQGSERKVLKPASASLTPVIPNKPEVFLIAIGIAALLGIGYRIISVLRQT